jgi:hypothetical protein
VSVSQGALTPRRRVVRGGIFDPHGRALLFHVCVERVAIRAYRRVPMLATIRDRLFCRLQNVVEGGRIVSVCHATQPTRLGGL